MTPNRGPIHSGKPADRFRRMVEEARELMRSRGVLRLWFDRGGGGRETQLELPLPLEQRVPRPSKRRRAK